MADQSFDTNPVSLRSLLTSIEERKLALPDFQRDFVWEPPMVVGLLVSLAKHFPAGSLLLIRCGPHAIFEERAVEGAPHLEGTRPEQLVLDGQQRLTSLYGALMGSQGHRFFLRIKDLLENKDFEECVDYVAVDALGELDTIEKQAETMRFPLDRTFKDGGFQSWAAEVAEKTAEGGDASAALALRKKLDRVYADYIRRIEYYAFPVVTLRSDTSPEAVCQIFSTINSTGVQLTVFDLLGARLWAQGVRLLSKWIEARRSYPSLERFLGSDGYPVLQALALRSVRRCTRKPILELGKEVFDTFWEEVIDGFSQAIELLVDECGVLSPKYLPFGPSLVPMAAAWHRVRSAKGPRQGELREKLKRWFWCASFGLRYESSVNSKLETDYTQLDGWLGRRPGAERGSSRGGV